MISIIVPVYNAEKTLRQCLDSIICQSPHNYEVIVVDDGSIDASPMICDEYARKYDCITTIHKRNAGVSSARNVGIEAAKGKLVTFVDADDWVEPNYCMTIANTEADLTFFAEKWHYSDGSTCTFDSGEDEINENIKAINEKLFYLRKNSENHEYFGFTWNKVFRLDIIRKYNLRFEEGLSFREDEVFTQEYSQHIHSLRILSDRLYNYRCTQTGLTFRTKTPNEYLLLISKIQEEARRTSINALKEYELSRIPKLYFLAMKSESNKKRCIELFQELRCFCKNNHVRIPTRSVKYILKHFSLLKIYIKACYSKS